MFKHILVPLDGSALAESAIPPAVHLAKALRASVTIIHIIEEKAPEQVHGERHLTNPDDACAYLDQVAKRDFPPDILVDQHVHTNEEKDVARSIINHAGEFAPDLIIMCTHGRGGLRDIIVGSIAQQVVAGGRTPVMLIHPKMEPQKTFYCRNILVPLDGKPEHEKGLLVAESFAKACQAGLSLISIVPTLGTLTGENAATGRLMPVAMSALLDLNQDSAVEYLRQKVTEMKLGDVPITTQVWRGDPAPTIIEAAKKTQTDLIVLGTHGKAGSEAFWSGSVAPKLTTITDIPLLFVPIKIQPE